MCTTTHSKRQVISAMPTPNVAVAMPAPNVAAPNVAAAVPAPNLPLVSVHPKSVHWVGPSRHNNGSLFDIVGTAASDHGRKCDEH